MASEKSELTWFEQEISELPQGVQERYMEMKATYRAYAEIKRGFEEAMQDAFAASLPEGSELKFGYNFGKLSIAVGPKRERKQAKEKKSLQEWLAEQGQ